MQDPNSGKPPFDPIEAAHGPHRVVLLGEELRGFWHREDAEDEADTLARKGLAASVAYRPSNLWPRKAA